MADRRSASSRCGFTLIELLVVVAIIALLIALLLPSLARAKQQAMTVRCGAQLKGAGALVALYASQNNDALPPNFTMAFESGGDLVAFDPPTGPKPSGKAWSASYIEVLGASGIIDLGNYWYNSSYKWGANCALTQNKVNHANALVCPSARDGYCSWDLNDYLGKPRDVTGNGYFARGFWGYGFTSYVHYGSYGPDPADSSRILDRRNHRRLGSLDPSHIMMSEGCSCEQVFYGIYVGTPSGAGSNTPSFPGAINLPSNGYGGVGVSYSSKYFDGVHLRHMYGTTANYLIPDFHFEASNRYHLYTYANINTDPSYRSNIWFQP
jgi:prepilin-type N-terminal cleavage/methylation domain-containing protein